MRLLRVLAPAAVCLSLLAACGDDSDTDASQDDSTSEVARTGDCEWVPADGPAGKEVDPPAEDAEPAEAVVLETSAGDVPIELNPDAVCAATSFTWLAEQGYYDDTTCHRMIVASDEVPYGILQCGDPTGSGTTGPGYTFADELTGDESYDEGTLAMANSGPDTNGSQFFLNYADSEFDPDYTLFGTIAPEGVKVLEDVAAEGTDSGGPEGAPAEELVIESARVDS
ncbi:peptidylprolyl isomerase [Aeromicrobium sp. CTD01-1L150]|uniref:peptidylprolyl isomerase n=1 Tax=Aeromicrobium sp. CTD01-1L150 TaxID=3341830 RepID=UPI0035BF41C7